MTSSKERKYEQWAQQAVMYPFPLLAHEPLASRPESPLLPPSPVHLKESKKEQQDDLSSLLNHIKSLNLKEREFDKLVIEVKKISRQPTPYPSPLPNGRLKANELKLMDEGFAEESDDLNLSETLNPLHQNTAFSLSPLNRLSEGPSPIPTLITPDGVHTFNKRVDDHRKTKHRPPPILMYSRSSTASSGSSALLPSVTFSTQSDSGQTFGSQRSTPSHLDSISGMEDEGNISDISGDLDDIAFEEILSLGKRTTYQQISILRNLPIENHVNWSDAGMHPKQFERKQKYTIQLIPNSATPKFSRLSPQKSPYPNILESDLDDDSSFEDEVLIIDDDNRFKRRLIRLRYELGIEDTPIGLYRSTLTKAHRFVHMNVHKLADLTTNPVFACAIIAAVVAIEVKSYLRLD